MIKITEKTLSILPGANSEAAMREKQQVLARYCMIMKDLATGGLEVTPAIYRVLADMHIVNDVRLIVRVSSAQEMEACFEAEGFVSSGRFIPGTVLEMPVEQSQDVLSMKAVGCSAGFRVTGIDDALLYEYDDYFYRIRKIFGRDLELCPGNKFHCAAAIGAEWILSGGNNVITTLFGFGGYAAFEEVFMALRIASRYRPNLDISCMNELKSLFKQLTGKTLCGNKPVVGENLFTVEAGIHFNGMKKASGIYEPYPAETVGLDRVFIVGKHSGRSSISKKLEELGVAADASCLPCILCRCRTRSMQLHRNLFDDEFRNLALEIIEAISRGEVCRDGEAIHCGYYAP